jgi:tRNA-Thr(GGU) m(6)t(6)A37 methyltransferase TsaA
MSSGQLNLTPIGWVRSPLRDRSAAPLQGDEGAPEAVIQVDEAYRDAMRDLVAGDEVLVLTWLHEADRDVLVVHPRSNPDNPTRGVFSTRSPDRPNPIGLHRVRVVGIDGLEIRVQDLEAIEGTPVLDVKPVLGAIGER